MTWLNESAGPAVNRQRQSDPWRPSPRVERLLNAHQSTRPSLGAQRAIHYTEFYKTSASRFPNAAIRKAMALSDHLKRRDIAIYPDELIVGTHTEHRIGAICHVEYAGFAMLEDLFRFEKRSVNPLHVDPQARQQLLWKVIPCLSG